MHVKVMYIFLTPMLKYTSACSLGEQTDKRILEPIDDS